jgi:hypothetical protein
MRRRIIDSVRRAERDCRRAVGRPADIEPAVQRSSYARTG